MKRLPLLLQEVRACSLCSAHLPLGPRPVVQADERARILIVGQAPGRKVHETGLPFNDPSGDRLRDWMGVTREVFYDAAKIAIVPMGFCFPGSGRNGDLPPRPECAPAWRAPLLAQLTQVELVLVIGQYAQAWHLPAAGANVTAVVQGWRQHWPQALPLPHPSPRNNLWFKRNPWFAQEVLPLLRARGRIAATMTLTPNASRAEYARRMNRVLNYIEQHLDQPLELAELADVANFSRFHFHRIFVAWMGETLGDYARRRRLEKAAFLLASGKAASVLDAALATGFGSGEAFARAFKLKFGCTPSAWRDATPERLAAQAARIGQGLQSNPDQVLRNPDQAGAPRFNEDGVSPTSHGDYAMEVNVIDLPAVRVAYHRRIGAYGPGIGEFWRGTVAPWMQSHGLMANTCYGVGYDDPSITPADKCRYDACVAVDSAFQPGARADVMTLPGGRYAVARFQAPTTAIHDAWNWLTREWLPSSGLQCDDRPCFERFDATTGLDPQTGVFTCDICIPVRAL